MRSVTGLNWPLLKLLFLDKPVKYLSLNVTQCVSVKNIVIHQKCASSYFYIGGFVVVYLSKIAATIVGPILPFKNIRILHGCEVRIENSIPRVTVWHHEALPSDAQ